MPSLLDPLRQLRNALRRKSAAANHLRIRQIATSEAKRAIEEAWIYSRAGSRPARILSIGSERTFTALCLAAMGHSVVSIDSTTAPSHFGLQRISRIATTLSEIDFPGSFDVVAAVSSSGLETHSIGKLMAPGGRLLLTTTLTGGSDEQLTPFKERFVILSEGYWRETNGAWEVCTRDQALSSTAAGSRALAQLELSATANELKAESLTSLALITSCKPFKGRDGENQNIALASWRAADIEVVIAGDEAKGVASGQGAAVVSKVRRAHDLQSAAPYLRSIIETGLENSSSPWVCLCNADIVIPLDFKLRLSRLVERHGSDAIFTVRRRDLNAHSLEVLKKMPVPPTEWTLHSPVGTDLFIASRAMWQKLLEVMPDFVFGRVAWDNWMHCCMIRLGKPVDASWALEAYHLPHGYEIQAGESLNGESHTETPSDRHNRTQFQSSPIRIGEIGDIHVDGHWFIGEP